MEVSFTLHCAPADAWKMQRVHGCQCAYTLIELIAALAIVAVLFSLAAPSFSELTDSNRMTTHINRLIGHLHYARSEAAKRNQRVVICKSANGRSCTSRGEWTQGYIIFADTNQDRSRDEEEPILVLEEAARDKLHITFGAFPTPNYVLYYPDGRSMSNGTFSFCDARGSDLAKALILYKSGRLRTSPLKPNGDPPECPNT